MTRTGDQDRNSSMMMLTSDGSTWVSAGAVPCGPRARKSRPSTLGAKASSRTRPSSNRSILGGLAGGGSGVRAGRWPPGPGGPYCQPDGTGWGGAAPAQGGGVGGRGPPAGGSTGVHPQGGWAGGGGGSVGSATKLLADVGNPSVPQAARFTVW